MRFPRLLLLLITPVVAFCTTNETVAQKTLNGHLLNRPMTDNRLWHLGFYVGMQFQDLHFAHNGEEMFDGTKWYMDQPSASPGFNIGGLIDFRLNNYFNLRFCPGLYFGSKSIRFAEKNVGEQLKQTIKSTYLVIPFDIKFSAIRYRNSRPYISAGIMPAFDLTGNKGDLIRLSTFDTYVTIALGCDFYLPFFKLIPELKFCFGLCDILQHDRKDLEEDPITYRYTKALRKATSSMVSITFYFE